MDYLKSNRDCALCGHYVLVDYEDPARQNFVYPPPTSLPRRSSFKFYLPDLLNINLLQTNSAVYRWRFRNGLPDWFRADLCPADWYWNCLHAEKGKAGFIPEIMGVYRRHPRSLYASSFMDDLEHKRRHGLGEMKTYKALNDHFKGRYFRILSEMASGVLAAFMRISVEQGDNSLMDAAKKNYPDFTLAFLQNLKKIPGKKANPDFAGRNKAQS